MSSRSSREDLSDTVVENPQPKEPAKMKVDELKDELRRRKLKTSGKKDALVERLKAALVLDTAKDDESEDEQDGGDTDSDNDDDDAATNANVRRHKTSEVLSIRDVEASMQTFSGDDAINIHGWLDEFEEMATLCKWTDLQKVIYAKRLLTGSAKIFVRFARCGTSWKKLKDGLQEEFASDLDVYNVTKELRQRKKQPNETNNEYIYRMCEIAGRMNKSSIIKYIIEGIDDKPVNKSILYGATTIQELKRKFAQYENMREEAREKGKSQDDARKKKQTTHAAGSKDNARCTNCGSAAHSTATCPAKSKGRKCFNCNQFGHIANKCPAKDVPKEVCNITEVQPKKSCKQVEIMDAKVTALIDTGSDLNLIRADLYVKIGAPKLGKITRFNGIGTEQNCTLGQFETVITIDEYKYPITFHVVSDTLLKYGLLIGTHFLNGVEVHIKDGHISISEIKDSSTRDDAVPEVFKIDVVNESEEIDLLHIKEPECRQTIKDAITNYKPHKVRDVGLQMNLILTDENPVYQRPRRLSPCDKAEVDKQIGEWLNEGIIQHSYSDYASPVVLVKKKDGSSRLCVDYRELNRKIVKERFPLPLIEDQIDALQGARIFTALDLKNGFFHVAVGEKSRKYTAFVVPNGHYEFLRMPFGLCNSPSVFQKYINAIFRELIASRIVFVYMDDLIIPADNVNDGIDNLRLVLNTASLYGLQFNWKKCKFLEKKIEYLGYIIEDGKVQPSENKIAAVVGFPKPKNAQAVQSFLGLTGYFRKFVPFYSIIARPLSNLLRKNVAFMFGCEEQSAFERLKLILSSKPVLCLYKTNADTELHTDACSLGFGAILMQRDSADGRLHPVYYSSGKTSPAEEKYCSYELEVLAIIKALRKFRVYLLGIPFKIVTDCKAFTMTINKKDLCVRVARWALLLEEFSYTIEHRSGKKMAHVDALSRNPLSEVMYVEASEETVLTKIRRAQQEDSYIQTIVENLAENKTGDFSVKNGLLYKNVNDDLLLVVPKNLQTQIIRRTHEQGHFAVSKTELLLRRDFWFEGMRSKVEKVLRSCINCILAERKQGKQEGWLHTIDKGEVPFSTYHIDHLGPIPSTKKNYRHIFVVIDAFSKFVWLYSTKSTTTAEVLSRLKKQSATFGNPGRIVSDRGTAFTSTAFEEYCEEEGIEHILITTGVPRGNGQVERVNRTLIPLLTKMSAPKPDEWYRHLDLAQKYLNAVPSRSTGTSPFHLLFGTHMKFKENQSIRKIVDDEWTKMFQEDRDELRKHARENISKIQEENRRSYNKRRKEAVRYKEGDLVAIKRTQGAPGLKLHPKFLGPYEVVKVLRNDRYLVQKVGEHEGPFSTSSTADFMKLWNNEDSEDNSATDEDHETI